MTDGSVSPAPTPSAQEKLRIAGDPGTSPEMLDELSQSRDELIRGAVARNPSAPPRARDRLRADPSPHVSACLESSDSGIARSGRRIRKARRITGHTLAFRDVSVEDAEFILSMRTDIRTSRYLSTTSPHLANQQEWLRKYAESAKQAYFIILSHQGEALGTVRLYDPIGDSFCWGSWIIKNGAPPTCAIESTLMVYDYALEFLGFSQTHINIRKSNRSVRLFHERFGGKKVGETLDDDLYVIEREAIIASVSRYRRFLPSSIKVEFYK